MKLFFNKNRNCKKCGTEFFADRINRQYCDNCRYILCGICGKSILVKPGISEPVKFCSKKCSSKSRVGTKRSSESIEKSAIGHRGKKKPTGYKIYMSNLMSGEGNHRWRGGVTKVRVKLSNSREYRDWRKAVFERDNYTCRKCNKRGVEINADHIIPYFKDKEKLLDVNNGQTLCVQCHKDKTRLDMLDYWNKCVL